MAYFGKAFKLVKQENYEDLIKSSSFSKDLKDAFISSKSSVMIVKNGDGSYTLSSISSNGTRDMTFKIGVEQEDTFLETVKTKSLFTVDGDTFTQVIKMGDNETTVKRVFSDNELVVTMKSNTYSGEAKRYYKA